MCPTHRGKGAEPEPGGLGDFGRTRRRMLRRARAGAGRPVGGAAVLREKPAAAGGSGGRALGVFCSRPGREGCEGETGVEARLTPGFGWNTSDDGVHRGELWRLQAAGWGAMGCAGSRAWPVASGTLEGRSQGPGVGSLAQRRPASPSRAWRRKVGSGQRQASRTLSHVPRAPCASHAVTEQRTPPPAALAVLGKPVPCSHRCHHRALPLRTGTWLAGGTRRAGPGSRAGCWAVALLATAAATPVSGALIGTPGPWHGSSAEPRAPALCSLSAGVHLQIFLLFVLCLFFFFPLPGDSLSQL